MELLHGAKRRRDVDKDSSNRLTVRRRHKPDRIVVMAEGKIKVTGETRRVFEMGMD
jgi:hypothetical protein